ncbi:MAG: DMT family transporter [Anaerolineales bacterium]
MWGASFTAKVALQDISPITISGWRSGWVCSCLARWSRCETICHAEEKRMGIFRASAFWGSRFINGFNRTACKLRRKHHRVDRRNDSSLHGVAWLVYSQGRIITRQDLGITLAFFGVLLVVSDGNLGSISIGKFGAPGDILILVSAVNWAVVSVLSRRGLKTTSASPFVFYMMLFGWLFTSIPFVGNSLYVEVPAELLTVGSDRFLESSVRGWRTSRGTTRCKH